METIHAALDGADRSGHGAKDVLRVCLARSSVGAEPAPTGAGKKAPRGAFYYWGQRVELANKW